MNQEKTLESPNKTTAEDFRLSPQQVAYFDTFGFLKLPELFKADVKRLSEGFEEVFAKQEPDLVLTDDPLQQTNNPVFEDMRRTIIYNFIEKSDKLRWLSSDSRVVGIVTSIMGENYELRPTDAHIFDCDTSWHPDLGSDDHFRLKLSFYLDSQTADRGAIRLIPGSHHETSYAKTLFQNLYGSPEKVKQNYGVEAHEIPSWTVESEPGDLICWNFRTFHASFHGFGRRRLFSMTFREGNEDAS